MTKKLFSFKDFDFIQKGISKYLTTGILLSLGYSRNFLKFSTKWIDSRNIPYDYGSIMHYARAFFSRMPALLPTLVTHKDHVKIGQRIALSKSDVLQANILYNCDGKDRF